MKYVLGFVLGLVSLLAFADCKNALHLEGVATVDVCDPQMDKCVPGGEALYAYMNKTKDAPSFFLSPSMPARGVSTTQKCEY